MSCEKCGFCEAELPTVQNIALDARSRGNYKFATLLDAALENCGVLRENLQANEREYLKDISRVVKKQSSEDACVNLLKDAKNIVETTKGRQSSEPTMRGMGFANMFEAARGSSNAPTPEHIEPELRSSSGFIRMLEASSKNASSEDAIQRALDEIEQDEAKYIQSSAPRRRTNESGFMAMCEVARGARTNETAQPEPQTHSGFLRMLDSDYQVYVTRGSEGTHDRIPYGFSEMLEAAFPHGNPIASHDKPHAVRRGMGFGAMLEGARSGTE
jgi:hypothetical protein